jgi:chitinase
VLRGLRQRLELLAGHRATTVVSGTYYRRQNLIIQSAIAALTTTICLLVASLLLLASIRAGVFQAAATPSKRIETSTVPATAAPTTTATPTATIIPSLTAIPYRALTVTATHGPWALPPTTPSVTPSPEVSGPVQLLPFNVIDARYSLALDRIIVVSEDPDQLHIFDPIAQTDAAVDLSRAPRYVTLSPDGMFAAVAHDALVSYIDLQTPILVRELAFSAIPADIVLPGNGWIYISTRINSSKPVLYAVEIETGTEYLIEAEGVTLLSGANFEVHPGGQWLYGVNLSGGIRINLASGFTSHNLVFEDVTDEQSDLCGRFWISPDGHYVYTRCGTVLLSAKELEQDLKYLGELAEEPDSLVWVTPVDAARRVLAIEEETNLLRIWDIPSYELVEAIPMPACEVNRWPATPEAHFVFANRAGTSYFVIVEISQLYAMNGGLISASIP